MKRVLVLLMPLMIVFAACSSTNVLNSWKDAEVAEQSTLKKVMVIAFLPETQRALRQEMEYEMVEDLEKRGIAAVSALQEYGPKAFEGMNEKQVMQQLDKNKIDGVITMGLQDTETNERYVPGSVRYEPYAVRYNRFYRTYQTFYERIYTPGYTEERTNYFFETNLYHLNSNKLLYSVQSKSFDPSSASQIAKEVAKAVVKDMEKNKVLGLSVAKN